MAPSRASCTVIPATAFFPRRPTRSSLSSSSFSSLTRSKQPWGRSAPSNRPVRLTPRHGLGHGPFRPTHDVGRTHDVGFCAAARVRLRRGERSRDRGWGSGRGRREATARARHCADGLPGLWQDDAAQQVGAAACAFSVGFGISDLDLGFRACDLGFRVCDLGFRV
jgi:hypothetical protein